jgi:hypothetical protein
MHQLVDKRLDYSVDATIKVAFCDKRTWLLVYCTRGNSIAEHQLSSMWKRFFYICVGVNLFQVHSVT